MNKQSQYPPDTNKLILYPLTIVQWWSQIQESIYTRKKKYKDERNGAIAAQEKIGETVLLKLCVQHNHKIGVCLINFEYNIYRGLFYVCILSLFRWHRSVQEMGHSLC
jgi:hypothetical protein